ncbi:hypothetical protein [Longimicrobium sp.]|jgi:hypothetical protein|uniref:hypothetical protein n=1 Tax=Longimicrobium sp. TaxID=2029185 RepID=UPI002F947E43
MTRFLRSLPILAAAFAAGAANAQSAGETSLAFSVEYGVRMGVSLSLKTFVADQVALRCTATGNAGIYAASCGAQRYGVFSEQTFVGVDIGGTTIRFNTDSTARRENRFPAPRRYAFAAAALGVQGRWYRLEEIRPYLALGPALAIGEGADEIARLAGVPSFGRVQPLYTLEGGLEFFAVSH